MRLNNEQQEEVKSQIHYLGYKLPVLVDELTDHVCTAIETEMEQGLGFEEARLRILGGLTREDTEKLHSKVIGVLLKDRSIKKKLWRYSIIMTLSLVLWVVIEYLAWLVFEIPELGPYYGLLSVVIMFVVLWGNLSKIKEITGGVIQTMFIFKNGVQLSFISGCFFLLFLVFFWTYIDPEFYRGFQMQTDEAVNLNVILYSSLSGMFMGVFGTGVIVSGIFSLIHKLFKKSH